MSKQTVSIVFDGTEGDKSVHTTIAELCLAIEVHPFQKLVDARSPRNKHLKALIVANHPISEEMILAASLEIRAFLVECGSTRRTEMEWEVNTLEWATFQAKRCIMLKHEGLARDVHQVLQSMLKDLRSRQRNLRDC